MLKGAIGYITQLSRQIQSGKVKAIEELSEKLNIDGMLASGA